MKKRIIRYLIRYCTKKALRLKQCEQMLLDYNDSFDYVYAIGVVVIGYNKWMRYVLRLQKLI